jgi:protein gp37
MARRLAAMGMGQYKQVIQKNWPGADKWNGKTAFIPSELEKPYKWRKPRTVFVSSMGDLFHESVWRCWIDDVMRMVANNSQHTFIFLTKRPERIKQYFDLCDRELVDELTAYYQLSHGTDPHNLAANWPLPNLVIGVTAENQSIADTRIPILLKIPAAKRFISLEPMLGPVDLSKYLTCDHKACNDYSDRPCDPAPCPSRAIDGVILGGESGNKGRRMEPLWVMAVRNQCAESGVPFMFKQWHHENRNEVDETTGFPWLGSQTHSALAW